MPHSSESLLRLKRVDGGEYLLDSASLTRHTVVFGSTGSGKTVLSKGIVEAAALSGIPVLAIDPKGDIGSLAVQRDGQIVEDNGVLLEDSSGTGERSRFNSAVEVRIFTPRSGMGIPVSLSPRLDPPMNFGSVLKEDPPLAYEMLELTSSTVGKLVGVGEDEKVKLAFIAAILENYWMHGRAVHLRDLVESIRKPPFEKFGELKVEEVFEKKERSDLISRMNLLLTDPGIKSWFIGEPVDFDRWFSIEDKVPVNVVDLRGVASEIERQVFVEYLLEQLFFWMVRQKGSQSLKYLLYFDEIHGYCPPVRAPASKKVLLRLVKMARAYGLGMVLATQNPSDLDYKVLSNCNIRFIGSLPMRQDIERVRLGLELGEQALETLSSLRRMEFYCQIFDQNTGFLTVPGQLHTLHAGPLDPAEVRRLMEPLKNEWTAEEKVELGELGPGKEVVQAERPTVELPVKTVSDSLPFKVGLDDALKVPLHGPLVLKQLKLQFDPYYVMDYEVNTWKQFAYYGKEVRVKGKGSVIVDTENGSLLHLEGTGVEKDVPLGKSPLKGDYAKTVVSGKPGIVDVPVHTMLKIDPLGEVGDVRDAELAAKQHLSDRYEKTVKLVGVRTSREASVKPSARDVRFGRVKLVRVPVWTVKHGIEGTDEVLKRQVAGADGTVLLEHFPTCSSTLHEIKSGSIVAASCGHAVCSRHLHGCLTCMREFCGTCRPILVCGHVACAEHTQRCALGLEETCRNCGENSCEHSTCQMHRRDCEYCGKTVCMNCAVAKGVLRRRYACSKECAAYL